MVFFLRDSYNMFIHYTCVHTKSTPTSNNDREMDPKLR